MYCITKVSVIRELVFDEASNFLYKKIHKRCLYQKDVNIRAMTHDCIRETSVLQSV